MKRAELCDFEKPFVIKECELPECPPDGLIVKIEYAGVCQTDLRLWNPAEERRPIIKSWLPLVIGHEISGYVFQLGTNKDPECHLKMGDRVCVYALLPCDKCAMCRNNLEHNCEEPYRAMGIHAPGGYATHVSVSKKKYALKLPESIPLDIGAVLGCAGLTSFNSIRCAKDTVKLMTKIKNQASVLLIGCGGLGQWAISFARAIFPAGTKIVAADISEVKLKTAKELGADDVVFWDKDLNEKEILERTKTKGIKNGFDCVIDYVSAKTTVQRGIEVLHKGGLCVLIGSSATELNLGMATNEFIKRGLTVTGFLYGTVKQFQDLIQLMSDKKLKYPELTTFPLKDAHVALERLRNATIPGRAVLEV